MWLAFNQMRRIIKPPYSSRLYEYARFYISNEISSINKGRIHNEKFRQKCSDCHKNTLIAKRKDSDVWRRVSREEYYKSPDLFIPFGSGRVTSDETKRKMSENGIKGKSVYNDGIVQKYFKQTDNIPKDFIIGSVPEFGRKVKERLKGVVTYYDPIEKRHFRKPPDFMPPAQWEKGRKYGTENGLAKMNSGRKQVYNLKTKNFEYCDCLYEDEFHIFTPGNGGLVIWKNFIFESVSLFNELNGKFYKTINRNKLNLEIKFHHNVALESQAFFLFFSGKTMTELGFDIISLKHYNINVGDNLIRRDNECRFKNGEFRTAFANETGFGIRNSGTVG